MKTVAFVNHKGGVGKTICSLSFSEGLARKGKSVLLVDLDQQMNATQAAGYHNTDGIASAYDVLLGEKTVAESLKDAPFGKIVPGDVLLADAETEMSFLDTPLLMLKDALETVDDAGFDYCVIDCPPSLGYVTRNAMVAADDIIVVVQPDKASVDGFGRIWEVCARIRGNKHLNPDLRIAGVLLNGFDWNRRLSRISVAQLPSLAEDLGHANVRYQDQALRVIAPRTVRVHLGIRLRSQGQRG